MVVKLKQAKKGILGSIVTLLAAYGGYVVKGLVGGAIAAVAVACGLLYLRRKKATPKIAPKAKKSKSKSK